MSISSVGGFQGAIGAMGFVGAANAARQEKPSSSLAGDLDQIRQKGLGAWAHDQQMEKLRQRLRAEVLSDRHMTEGDVAAMKPESRASIEDEIAKLIDQKLQEAMKAKVEDAAGKGKTEAVLLNISV
ncbi:hypothetical protein [Brevundimonas sp. SORGH_AS_0993]|uniref:hypothetical protein n=1 Tax=Brevundimonas sp. SORGH_AS_0993 TaxID=3041794 RepID=UPI00278296A3|nr:hypothetical protein [Brevundimonas sp. SORGH_AS_0993]MDQ1154580.1 hypothetical protein [Brevundimonas sp. SORGH_AS_0993]